MSEIGEEWQETTKTSISNDIDARQRNLTSFGFEATVSLVKISDAARLSEFTLCLISESFFLFC